jgi:tellurite resistance protein
VVTASPRPGAPAPSTRFGEATPPAIFPPVLGALGLGVAWRRAAEVFPVPALAGEFVLAASAALYVLCLASYVTKLARRPGVLADDVRILPGRAGLSAAVLCIYVLATAADNVPGFARALLALGFALHVALLVPVTRAVVTGPPEQRPVTPVWHLQFVGFVVGGVAAATLGLHTIATVVLVATGIGALAIWGVSLAQLRRGAPAPPLRPLLAIHLAPASLLGTVALLTDHPGAAVAFALAAAGIAIALALALPRLLTAGFTPLWSAFTFPLAAFAGFLIAMAAAGHGTAFRLGGGAALAVATLVTPPILLRIMRAWATGSLAAGTGAARA